MNFSTPQPKQCWRDARGRNMTNDDKRERKIADTECPKCGEVMRFYCNQYGGKYVCMSKKCGYKSQFFYDAKEEME